MKKLIILFVIMVGASVGSLSAQTKFGHINTTEILLLMPEMVNVKNKLDTFNLGLKKEYENEVVKYEELVKEYEQMVKDSVSLPLLESKYKDVINKQQKIQELPGLLENEFAEKQMKLLKPLQEKLKTAITDVAKEKGLSYVFDTGIQVLIIFDPADDISKDVRKKLNIPDNAVPVKFDFQ